MFLLNCFLITIYMFQISGSTICIPFYSDIIFKMQACFYNGITFDLI